MDQQSLMNHSLPNTISGLLEQIACGEITVQQALRLQEQQFRTRGEQLQCVSNFYDSHWNQTGSEPRPMSGVAVAHKDIFDQPGRLPGLGRDHGQSQAGVTQALAPARLAAAGCVDLGALAMAEDACAAVAMTRRLPTPINPLGAQVAVGGSSSGSGVAVAAGMVYASLGTDTAGSVRMPAMTCGVMGLKTTHGLISRQGVAPLSVSLDSVGILARSTQDLRLVLKEVCEPGVLKSAPNALRASFWWPEQLIAQPLHTPIQTVMHAYAKTSIDIARHEARATQFMQVIMAHETGLLHHQRIANGLACPEVAELGTLGLALPHPWYMSALQARAACLKAFLRDVFHQTDVLVVPLQTDVLPDCEQVYPGSARFSSRTLLSLHRLCGWVNYLGLPALAMPVAYDARGLPISVQIIGRPHEELALLQFAQRLEHEIHGSDGIAPSLVLEDLQHEQNQRI
jgi:Asp-tRNA(Asn)/Glu-tRNA(Gln) amidotransferase A subunit family amidase